MKKILLSALGLLGLAMQPDLPEISEPQKWRHLYKVFYRNAVNETLERFLSSHGQSA